MTKLEDARRMLHEGADAVWPHGGFVVDCWICKCIDALTQPALTPDMRQLIQHVRALVEDPLMFSTDPDGECFFCGEPCEPVAEHDADSDCRMFQMRKAWGEFQAAAVLAAVTR